MPDAFARMEMLLGDAGTDRLGRAKIVVFGLGGAGSYAAEALARCGVASLTLVDNGTISADHINRQLYALRSTIGRSNVEIAKARIRDIDEGILVHTYDTFYNEETVCIFELGSYDYIVDAMDTVDSKLLLIQRARECNTPVISCMWIGNRTDPFKLETADISRVTGCVFTRMFRAQLRKRGIRRVKVLYSREKPEQKYERNTAQGSISFVTGTAGMMLAAAVVRDLLETDRTRRKRK